MDLKNRLVTIALHRSAPFCVECESEAPDGVCPTCRRECVARLLPGAGYDCGVDWIVCRLLAASLTPLDVEAAFAASIADCYGKTVSIAWLELDIPKTLRERDLAAWEQGKREWLHAEESAGRIITFDHAATYYKATDVETWLAAAEAADLPPQN
jgi:hypothetical protein